MNIYIYIYIYIYIIYKCAYKYIEKRTYILVEHELFSVWIWYGMLKIYESCNYPLDFNAIINLTNAEFSVFISIFE